MKTTEDYLLGILYFALAGIIWYLSRRLESTKEPASQFSKSPIPSQQKPKAEKASARKQGLVVFFVATFIIGLIYGIPEYFGRRDASGMCESIPVGEKVITDNNALYAGRKRVKEKFGTFFAASYYPKVKGIEDGNGAVVYVFLAGFPFSRAYCVLHVTDSVVHSKQAMFSAEDYEYCDGEMRGVWECSSENRMVNSQATRSGESARTIRIPAPAGR